MPCPKRVACCSYTIVNVAAGKYREINAVVWILAALFILRYVYLAAA